MISYSEYKKQKLQDKSFAEEYHKLDLAFLVAKEVVRNRYQKGLTQQQLAKLAGTKQSVISRLESGDSLPSLSLLEKIAHALNATIDIKFIPAKTDDPHSPAYRGDIESGEDEE